MARPHILLSLLVPIMLILAGCGGGGGGGTSGGVTPTITGIAAVGLPLAGTVYLKDSSIPPQERLTQISQEGSYSFDTATLKPPYIIKAVGNAASVNYTLFSFASGSGIANINPISDLAVVVACNDLNLSSIYSNPTPATMQKIALNLDKAVRDIMGKLQPILTLYDASTNPISGVYTANHLSWDGLLDNIKILSSASGTVTFSNKINNTVISTGLLTDPATWTPPTNIPQPSVVVHVKPAISEISTNQILNFSATVVNSSTYQVTWSIQEPGGGSITSAGVYTAPTTPGTYHIKAASVADPSKYGVASVVVSSGPIVNVSPTTVSVINQGTKTFTASVTGSTNTQVIWSVEEAGGGTITQSGLYTAPSAPGTYHIRATCVADTSKFSRATVTVTSVGVIINPSTFSIAPNSTMILTSSVTGTDDSRITWTIVEGVSGGTITSSGTYTAPATAGTYHVKAVSAADPRQSATAIVTVTQPFISISGKVSAGGVGLAGVTVATALNSATTDADGNYVLSNLSNGSYTITPNKNNYIFTPGNIVVTLTSSNVSGKDFTATNNGSITVQW